MTTRTATAWELIRAADPMGSVDVAGAGQAPSAQDLLHRITADLTAERGIRPGGEPDVLTLSHVGPGRVLPPRRRGLGAGLAAAVVVLLAAVTVVAVRRENPTAAPAPHQQTTAAGYAKALLAELPLPAGARRVDQPPIPELRQEAFTGNGILDARVAWWTVPGSFSATVASMGKAVTRPAHWNSPASSSGSAGPQSNGWLIEVRDPDARFVSSVNVVVAAHGRKVGLVAQVDTYAIPVRTQEQVIPASVDSATFAVTGGGGRSYSSRLTVSISGQRVKSLAREINATPTFVVLVVASCPASPGSVTVTFRRGSQRWVVSISAGSALCNTPTLTGAGGASVNLTPSTALLTDVLAAVGLPSDYFRR